MYYTVFIMSGLHSESGTFDSESEAASFIRKWAYDNGLTAKLWREAPQKEQNNAATFAKVIQHPNRLSGWDSVEMPSYIFIEEDEHATRMPSEAKQELLERVRKMSHDEEIEHLDLDTLDSVAELFIDDPFYYARAYRNRTADLMRARM